VTEDVSTVHCAKLPTNRSLSVVERELLEMLPLSEQWVTLSLGNTKD